FGAGRDLDTTRARLFGNCLADGAHTTQGMSPGSALAVHFAERVVQEHVGGAWRVGTREMADLRVESERGLDRVALEPVVEQVARAARDELPQVALRRAGEKREPPAQGQRPQPAAPASAEVGRCLEDQGPERVRRGLDRAVVPGQTLRVPRGKSGKLLLRIGEGRAEPERSP